jgi:hypothetical protein
MAGMTQRNPRWPFLPHFNFSPQTHPRGGLGRGDSLAPAGDTIPRIARRIAGLIPAQF